jgi:hypothetical protein
MPTGTLALPFTEGSALRAQLAHNEHLLSKVKSLGLATLGEITLSTASDGTGSLQFGSHPWGTSGWWSSGWTAASAVPSFESIPNAKQVQDLIRQAQRKALGEAR